MIRRNPTVIPMTDIDVQDVRDLVEKQRAEAQARQKNLRHMQQLADHNGELDDANIAFLMTMKDTVNKQKDEEERQRRLGMTGPAATSSSKGKNKRP